MKTSQKLELRASEIRQRLNEIAGLEGEAMTDEIRTESDRLGAEYPDVETRRRAAIIAESAESAAETRGAPVDGEARETRELRQRATHTGYLVARMQGRLPDGAEAEYGAAVGVTDGSIPLDLSTVEARAVEHRADTVSGAPSTTGVNLHPVQPAIFAPSIAPRLGISMPQVQSGTFATATVSTSLTAGTKAKGAAGESTAAALTVSTSGVKRITARLSLREEDIASVGQANFEAALRQNLSMVLSDQYDAQALTGNGQAPNLAGIFQRLTDAAAPDAVATFDSFAAVLANGVDGLWASRTNEVAIVVGVDTYRLSARTFQSASSYKGERTAAAFLEANSGGWWTNKRMPATVAASKVQAGIVYRKGQPGMQTAVHPVWNRISIDDIYTDSASATRHVTLHVLCGDVILVQPAAYSEVAFKVSA